MLNILNREAGVENYLNQSFSSFFLTSFIPVRKSILSKSYDKLCNDFKKTGLMHYYVKVLNNPEFLTSLP